MLNSGIRQVVTFAAVGAHATLIYAGVAVLLADGVGFSALQASTIAYVAASVCSYTGHCRYTFRRPSDSPKRIPQFVLTSSVGLATAMAMPWFLSDILGWPVLVSAAIACAAVPLISFIALRNFVFVRSETTRL